MALGHRGLKQLALKNNVDVSNLGIGEHVLFVNSSRTKLKMYAANNIIGYLSMPQRQQIALETLAIIPQVFMAEGKIDYEKALTKTIHKQLFGHKK